MGEEGWEEGFGGEGTGEMSGEFCCGCGSRDTE